ncbi:MAG: roadblock/LC7 domain-containing protein [Anaerolineae bacterium]|nr:roadblock/LC7 domain-containing protein [Anaerolineae bacterium]
MKFQPNGGHYSLRSGLTIYPSQDKLISQTLTELKQKLPAHLIVLVDVTGQVVSAQGEQKNVDLVSLGSLIAGDLAASQEIARLTGQYQDNQMVLREGQNIHTFIIEAGIHLAMLVQVAESVPLGWGRMLTVKSAQRLSEIVEQAPQPHEQTTSQKTQDLLGEEALSELFTDALDDLWME